VIKYHYPFIRCQSVAFHWPQYDFPWDMNEMKQTPEGIRIAGSVLEQTAWPQHAAALMKTDGPVAHPFCSETGTCQ
jgi:hypothetical protein